MIRLFLPILLTSLARAESPTLEAGQQATYPQQAQGRGASKFTTDQYDWDRIDVQRLKDELSEWYDRSSPSSTELPATDEEPIARQGYPEVPRPIPPIPSHPILPPHPLPKGCLGPRGQFPSPKSCAHYLNCWDDVVIEQQCPGGLLFNDLTGVCDFEYNVYCSGRPGPPPKPELPPGSKVCPDPNGRYRSSTNCSEFFVCVYGKPVKYSCPRGLVYNDDLGVCDYVYRVNCRSAAVPEPWYPPPPPVQPHPPVKPQPPVQPTLPPVPYPGYPQYPTYPTQPQYPPPPPQQPTYPPPSYTGNPWIETKFESNAWNQRSAATEIALEEAAKNTQQISQQQNVAEAEDTPTEPALLPNPWADVQVIPAQLTKVPCKEGDVHRLTESCSSVVVCRKGRPQLVQCPVGQIYDRPSDSCRLFTLAKC